MTAPSDLARQLVEHPRWTWQPGMVAHWHQDDMVGSFPVVVYETVPTRVYIVTDEGRSFSLHPDDADLRPDLDHPATKGWLLHMLREATGDQVDAHSNDGFWFVSSDGWHYPGHPTEGAALASALLAVWGAP